MAPIKTKTKTSKFRHTSQKTAYIAEDVDTLEPFVTVG